MKDLIDERNFREKCARSIVKGYNVRYVMPGEQKVETEEVEEARVRLYRKREILRACLTMRADGRIFRRRDMGKKRTTIR